MFSHKILFYGKFFFPPPWKFSSPFLIPPPSSPLQGVDGGYKWGKLLFLSRCLSITCSTCLVINIYTVKYFYRQRHRNERYKQRKLLKIGWECICKKKKALLSDLGKEKVLESDKIMIWTYIFSSINCFRTTVTDFGGNAPVTRRQNLPPLGLQLVVLGGTPSVQSKLKIGKGAVWLSCMMWIFPQWVRTVAKINAKKMKAFRLSRLTPFDQWWVKEITL